MQLLTHHRFVGLGTFKNTTHTKFITHMVTPIASFPWKLFSEWDVLHNRRLVFLLLETFGPISEKKNWGCRGRNQRKFWKRIEGRRGRGHVHAIVIMLSVEMIATICSCCTGHFLFLFKQCRVLCFYFTLKFWVESVKWMKLCLLWWEKNTISQLPHLNF